MIAASLMAQEQPPSIHQRDLEAHRDFVESTDVSPLRFAPVPVPSSIPRVNRTVYGFLPYWVATDISQVQWDLMTHVAYFSAEMNSNGSIAALHSWPNGTSVQALLAAAHANGVKVTLAATLFSPSAIGTLLGSSTNRTNAINNLLAQVQAGGADGVNIDFEGVPAAQKTNLVTFMTELTNAFHSAIPGSHVSIDTPAVDWSGAFDFDQLALACDGLFIMGYDYHWSTAPTAGPVAPLTGGSIWGTYNVTWTVNDYLTNGGVANRGKFILGVPYYGIDWPTTSTAVPSSTTAPGTSRLYNYTQANKATYGPLWDANSQTPYWVTSTGPRQTWYDDAQSLGLKWDLVNAEDLGGTGMWAMNYDTVDDFLWQKIEEKFVTPAGDLAGRKIGVDPGHGGTDTGAIGPTGYTEEDATLATSLALRDALEARGATVYMTRTADTTVSLTARSDYFNSIPVDRAESCHYNSSGTASANYTGVHIYDNGTNTCPASANSKDMAGKTALRLDAALSIGVVSTNCSLYGVHGDNFHMVRETTMPAMLTESSFISNPTEEGLLKTAARRCTIAGAIAKGLEDHFGVAAADPPCTLPPLGTCGNPIVIASLPYSDSNTTTGRGSTMNSYSCAPSTNEAGPEVVYRLDVTQGGWSSIQVSDGSGVDIDVHLLSSCGPAACLARADISMSPFLAAGTYYVVCDTWTNAGGTQLHGPYTLNISLTPDTVPPGKPSDVKWNAGATRWEWTAITLDRNGNAETMGSYEVYRGTNPANLGTTPVVSGVLSANWTDSSTPLAGEIWFYQVRARDAAGNLD